MAYALVSSRADSLGTNGGTTGTLDTSGADFLAVAVSTDSGVTLVAGDVSDSKTNTWTLLGTTPSGGFTRTHLFYAKNATVGTGHTFTVSKTSSYSACVFSSWSGSHLTAPADQSAGNGTSGTSVSSGSITPSENNCLVLTTLADDNGGTITDPTSFTRVNRQAHVAFVSYGVTLDYEIQTTATARDPSWSVSSSTGIATRTSSFKSAGGGGGGGVTYPELERHTRGVGRGVLSAPVYAPERMAA